jgi:DNA-binding winged helix-turn-helix (wHTH) protein
MLRFGCFQLDPIHGLRRGNEEVRVTPKSLSVLLLLVGRAGEIVTKDEIFGDVWRDTAVSDSALTSCIQELRHVLQDDARLPRFVETLHRRGYRFVAPVSFEEKNRPSVVSLPQATDNGPFVGRETAIQEMLRIWAKVEQGSRQMLFVTGEAGIGKTTVISGLLRNIPVHSRTWGQCIQHFGFGEPYEPLLDGITRLCRQSGGAKVVSAIERYGPTWLAQLPALLTPERYAALRRNVVGTTRERMFRELTDVMEAITHEAPLIFCLEDLHWSDPSTVEWIAAFAQRPEASRLLLIGTFRPSELAENKHPLDAIFRELKTKRFCHEIALHGLDESSIAEYVRVRFPWEVGQEGNAAQLVPLLHAQTDGNPLFVINVLGDLVDRHLLLESNGYWQLRSPLTRQDLGIPEDIRRVIDQQIGRLTASELVLLEVASVTGLTFSLSLVASVAGVSESSADEILASLCRQLRFIRRIVALDGSKQSASAQFEFIHVLYRDTLYQRISPIRLRDLHRTIGICEELALGEQASSVAAELAMHFECADDIPRALFYLEKAAQNARHRSAFTEARNFFDRALKLLKRQAPGLERTERQAVMLTGLGGVIMATQGWGASEAEEAYSQAWALRQNLGENPKLFLALWGLWLFYWGRGSLDIANEAVADLLTRGRQADDSALLCKLTTPDGRQLSRVVIWKPQCSTRRKVYDSTKQTNTLRPPPTSAITMPAYVADCSELGRLCSSDEPMKRLVPAMTQSATPGVSLIHSLKRWHSCSHRVSIRCCVIRWRRKHTRPPRLQSHANRDSNLCWLGRRRSEDGPKHRTEWPTKACSGLQQMSVQQRRSDRISFNRICLGSWPRRTSRMVETRRDFR